MMMRGTKRKIEIEKRETKQQRSVACSKRRKTVFSKASDLCRHGGANFGVLVSAAKQDSDVVYSFSGFSSSALDMADFYLNGKSPPPKLGFWWVDPNLYRYCDHLTEDHLERMVRDFTARLEKKENPQSVSDFDQNPTTTSSQDESSSSFSSSHQIVSDFDQNPSGSSRFVSDFALASSPSDISNSKFVSFGQDPNYSSPLHDIYGGSSSQNPSPPSVQGDDNESGFWDNLIKEDVFGLNNELWETQDEKNNSPSLTRETQTEPVVNVGGYDDEMSFWVDNLFKVDDLGLENNSLENEEDDYMIDISQFLNEEEIDLLQSDQNPPKLLLNGERLVFSTLLKSNLGAFSILSWRGCSCCFSRCTCNKPGFQTNLEDDERVVQYTTHGLTFRLAFFCGGGFGTLDSRRF